MYLNVSIATVLSWKDQVNNYSMDVAIATQIFGPVQIHMFIKQHIYSFSIGFGLCLTRENP